MSTIDCFHSMLNILLLYWPCGFKTLSILTASQYDVPVTSKKKSTSGRKLKYFNLNNFFYLFPLSFLFSFFPQFHYLSLLCILYQYLYYHVHLLFFFISSSFLFFSFFPLFSYTVFSFFLPSSSSFPFSISFNFFPFSSSFPHLFPFPISFSNYYLLIFFFNIFSNAFNIY